VGLFVEELNTLRMRVVLCAKKRHKRRLIGLPDRGGIRKPPQKRHGDRTGDIME
jgi:hypothetical protein